MKPHFYVFSVLFTLSAGCNPEVVPARDVGPMPMDVSMADSGTDSAVAMMDASAPLDAALGMDMDVVTDSAPQIADMASLPSDATTELDSTVLSDSGLLMDGAAPLADGGPAVADAGDEIGDAAAPGECVGPDPLVDEMPPEAIPEEQCMNCIGAPTPAWRMADFQPLSCGFEQTYGLDSFARPGEEGRATLVALFNAGCGYCRSQAENLERMRIELRLAGLSAHFVALNGHQYVAHQEGLAARCSYPILQDTEELAGLEAMDGAIYDMFVYRPDGTLHVFLGGFDEIDTYLADDEGYENVRAAILAAISGEPYVPPHPPVEIVIPDGGLPDGGQ